MTSSHTRKPDWRGQLMRDVMYQFGPTRAIADYAQIEHLASLLDLLDGWEPATYPDAAGFTVTDASNGDSTERG